MTVTETARWMGIAQDLDRVAARIRETLKTGKKIFPGYGVTAPKDGVEMIKSAVCHYYSVDRKIMTSPTRVATAAWPRQIAMALAYEFCGLSSVELAKYFNRRDHSTILHAYYHVMDVIEVEPAGRGGKVAELRAEIAKQFAKQEKT